MIEVILLERIGSLGFMGDRVKVRPGYARNFLLPKKKALRATPANIALFEKQKAHLEANNLEKKSDAEKVAAKINGVIITLIRPASEMGHLYGAVRSKDVSEALAEEGFVVHRSQVEITTPIKILGKHVIHVVLHPEVRAEITVTVAKSKEEADAALALEEQEGTEAAEASGITPKEDAFEDETNS